MKHLFYTWIVCTITIFLFHACDLKIEPESIQNPLRADEQYYENLRNYKKSDHAICYGWYAAYVNGESPSMGNHFSGLPDSMDIVSLWMGIPEGENLEDMYRVRKQKGTRFVLCSFCQIGDEYPHTDEGLQAFAMSFVNKINEYDLDGLDIDYEPGGDWVQGEVMMKLVKMLGQYLGPQSGTGKLLIMDYVQGPGPYKPTAEIEKYVDYFVCQTYKTTTAQELQEDFDYISSWCPPKKWVATEWIGEYWKTGGLKFTESDGNTVDSWGNPLYSAIGMARWNPKQGRKGGFGGYYFEYEYNTTRPANQSIGDKEDKPIPYYSLRRGIQEQNPAVK